MDCEGCEFRCDREYVTVFEMNGQAPVDTGA